MLNTLLSCVVDGNAHPHMQSFVQSDTNDKIKQYLKNKQEIAYIFYVQNLLQ